MNSPGAAGVQRGAAPVGRGRAPAGLPQVVAAAVDREAGAADRGHPGARVGEAGRHARRRRPCCRPRRRRRSRRRCPRPRPARRPAFMRQALAARRERFGHAPAVRDDVRQVLVDHFVDRLVEPAGVVGGADVDDAGLRRDGVRPLDVQRLLDVPALRLGGILRVAAGAGRGQLPVVAVVERGQAELAREAVCVRADGGREEGARDGDRLAAAVEAGEAQRADAVGGVDLRRRVAADQPGQGRAGLVRVGEPAWRSAAPSSASTGRPRRPRAAAGRASGAPASPAPSRRRGR